MARKAKNAGAGEALKEDTPGALEAEDVGGTLEADTPGALKAEDAGGALEADTPGALKAEDAGGALEEYIRVTGQRMEMRSIDSVIPYVRNARIHDAAQISHLRGSLRTFGFVKPIIIDEQGNLIAGHGILEAARAEGMTEVPCVVAAGLSEVERQAYILADNALAELSAWDAKMRGLEVKRLSSLGVNPGLLGLKTDKLGTVEARQALDLDDEDGDPAAVGSRRQLHCPKCGFIFEA